MSVDFFRLIPLLIAIIINSVLALLVFINNPKSATNRVYALLSFIISIWLATNYLVLDLHIIGGSLLWSRLTIFWATPMSFLFFLFAATIPNKALVFRRKMLFSLLFLTGVVMFVTISPYAFTDVKIVNNSLSPIPGPGIIPFSLLSTLYSIAAVYLLVKKYFRSKGIEKAQFFYVMLGILLMLGCIILTVLVPAVVFKSVAFVRFIPLYTLVFLGMTGYAIVKHKLLDLRLIVARSIAYLFVILVMGGLYSFYLLFIGSSLLKLNYGIRDYLFFGFAMFIVAFTFQPLRRLFEKHTDDLFYKGAYDSQKLLQYLSGIMSSSIALENLTSRILENVSLMMHISRGVFVLLKSKDGGEIEYVDAKGYDVSVPRFTKEEIQVFLAEQRIVLFDDLEEGTLKQTMRSLDLTVILPLLVNEEKIGILGFGDKSSGDVYSQQDINVLKLLAPQLSVAVQNSREYEEIKRFNITLRDEVDKATKGLQTANEQLKELDKLKDEFVSVASHELRTPMTSIRSYLWMALKGQGGKLLEKQEFYVQRAYNSVDRLIKLVNDMLNVSRIESGRISLDMKQVELVGLFQEVVDDLLPHAKELGIGLVLDKASGVSPVMADPDKIREVVFNLIGNSLKFTPSGGTITVSFVVKNGLVESRVSDTGAGIEADNLLHLFQKFGILPGSYTTNQSAMMGTGLGLYICKSIIELHGGQIWAESPGKGKGATFVFSLVEFSEDKLKEYLALHPSDQKEHMGLEHTQL